jgi:hypothetical protein
MSLLIDDRVVGGRPSRPAPTSLGLGRLVRRLTGALLRATA